MEDVNLKFNITGGQTAGAYTVYDGTCVLQRVIVNKAPAGTIAITDNADPIGKLKSGVAENSYEYGVVVSRSLIVTTGETGDITIVFRPS